MGEGRSTVVSRDVSDTHGLILPGLLRIFFASENVVVYEPTRPEHEAYAQQATDLVNYVVMREAEGYRHFRDAMFDGTLLGNGILKHWWDDTPEFTTETFTALSDEDYALLLDDDEVEEIEHEEYPDPEAEAQAALPAPDMPDMGMGMQPPESPMGGMGGMDAGMMPQPDPMAAMGAPMGAPDPMQGMQPGMDPMMGGGDAPAPEPDPMALIAAALGAQAMGGEMGGMQPPPPPMLHDVTIKRTTSTGRLRLECVPPEEFVIDRSAKVIDEKLRFCAHVYRETRSELIRQGFDKDLVESIPTYTLLDLDNTRYAREKTFDNDADRAPDDATEYVEVAECYVLVDYDGDGLAERRKIVVAGGHGGREVLANDEWGDDLPFTDIVPEPRPHTWRGRGLYDELADIQRIKTVVLRGTMDNIYQNLVPSSEVEENAYINMDAVYDRKFGDVLIRKAGKQPMQPVTTEFIAPKMFPVMDYMDGIAEKRTGVSNQSQALDMEALSNQSATAVNAAISASHSKIEEYARNIAECGGMKRIFKCILKLITKHQDRAKMIRLRGEFVPVDPRAWDASMDVVVNVGLGTGSRERDLAMLQGIAGKQEQIIGQAGPWNPDCNLGHLFDTYRKMAEAAGIRNADSHFPVITQEEVEQRRQQMEQASQGQQDPKAMEAQAKIQIEQQRVQMDMQRDQAKQQMDQAEFQMKMQAEQARMQFDAQQRQMEAQEAAQFRREEAAARLQLLREETAAKLQIAREEMQLRQQARMQELEFETQLAAHKITTDHNEAQLTNIPRPT
jgi:flagellar biosynthesis GTPase FlhF